MRSTKYRLLSIVTFKAMRHKSDHSRYISPAEGNEFINSNFK